MPEAGRACAALALLVILVSGCSWSQYRGDAAHTGYQPFEAAISVTNVSTLTTAWTGPSGAFAVSGGVLYGNGGAGLVALDAAGETNCSGVPKTCAPLWNGPIPESGNFFAPAVANGSVYVSGANSGSVWAFDAAGNAGCGGVPRKCTPLWTGASAVIAVSSPTVSDGKVYVGASTGAADPGLYVYDAAGVTGCTGIPKTCGPLWTGQTGQFIGAPAVANGVAYVASTDHLYAFDAAGVVGCGGLPKSCAPLWSASTTFRLVSAPAIANGLVYVGSQNPDDNTGALYAFDAAGVSGCTGIPKNCAPLWTAPTADHIAGGPAVTARNVFIGTLDGTLYAFDANGSTGCAGTPKTCAPLWTGAHLYSGFTSPAVANGVVYFGNGLELLAFDAAGNTGCSGIPKSCAPLWVSPNISGIGMLDPIIVNGTVFVRSYVGSNGLYAFRLPPG